MPKFPYFPSPYSKNPQYNNQFMNNSINNSHSSIPFNINSTPKISWENKNYTKDFKNQHISIKDYNNNINSSNNILNDSDNLKNNSLNYKAKNTSSDTRGDTSFFEIFGLKLYFDDILILCLLYFLYAENIKDEGLFIALILLLIT